MDTHHTKDGRWLRHDETEASGGAIDGTRIFDTGCIRTIGHRSTAEVAAEVEGGAEGAQPEGSPSIADRWAPTRSRESGLEGNIVGGASPELAKRRKGNGYGSVAEGDLVNVREEQKGGAIGTPRGIGRHEVEPECQLGPPRSRSLARQNGNQLVPTWAW